MYTQWWDKHRLITVRVPVWKEGAVWRPVVCRSCQLLLPAVGGPLPGSAQCWSEPSATLCSVGAALIHSPRGPWSC